MTEQVVIPETTSEFEAIEKLNKELRKASELVGLQEARHLVKLYYTVQNLRIRAGNQINAVERGEGVEPTDVIKHVKRAFKILENNIKISLMVFARQYTVGMWLQSICGIGPVLSAGFLSELDVRNRPTAGHFMSFAGIIPGQEKLWVKGAKRPWNADLKVLCFKTAESFIKVQNNEKDVYGHLYALRKNYEWERNLKGELADQAQQKDPTVMPKGTQGLVGKDTDAFEWYTGNISYQEAREFFESEQDMSKLAAKVKALKKKKKFIEDAIKCRMLPPAHIVARARRWVEKIFLSHVHHVMFMDYYQKDPPKPYIIQFGEKLYEDGVNKHTTMLKVPNWPLEEKGRSLQDLFEEPRRT
jgi:hypothetical protein